MAGWRAPAGEAPRDSRSWATGSRHAATTLDSARRRSPTRPESTAHTSAAWRPASGTPPSTPSPGWPRRWSAMSLTWLLACKTFRAATSRDPYPRPRQGEGNHEEGVTVVRRWADVQRGAEQADRRAGVRVRGGGRQQYDRSDGLVGIGELAEALGRSPATLRRWERRGVLPRAPYRSASRDPRGERRLYTPGLIEDMAGTFRRHRVGERLERHLWGTIRREIDGIYAHHLRGYRDPAPANTSRSSVPGSATAGALPPRPASVTRGSWSKRSTRVAGPT